MNAKPVTSNEATSSMAAHTDVMPVETPFAVTLQRLVAEDPDARAITDASGTLSRGELDATSNQWARALQDLGVNEGDIVSICLPSDGRFLIAAWAIWKLGATPQPLSARMVEHELREIVELTRPSVLIGQLPTDLEIVTWDLSGADDYSTDPLPVRISPSWKAPTSGGSTGRPKVILSTTPAIAEPLLAFADVLRVRAAEVTLTPAPLHHNAPFLAASLTMLRGGHVILMSRFDPEAALALITEHKVSWLYAVPTIMGRIAKLPAERLAKADLSSVKTLFHMAAPCADWLKRWWIEQLGADSIWELYAGTEVQAITVIGGGEWLQRPGSVGQVVVGEMVILDEAGSPKPAGESGEIYMRSSNGQPTYRYLGGTAKVLNGWESLGDIGWMDQDGYLFLNDRVSDMVLVGGVNVYPAEVEAVLDAHPIVESSCVIGLPDEDLGNRLHAVIHVTGEITDEELLALVASQLAPHKRPRTFERVDTPLRDEAGKVRRSAVRAARLEQVLA